MKGSYLTVALNNYTLNQANLNVTNRSEPGAPLGQLKAEAPLPASKRAPITKMSCAQAPKAATCSPPACFKLKHLFKHKFSPKEYKNIIFPFKAAFKMHKLLFNSLGL